MRTFAFCFALAAVFSCTPIPSQPIPKPAPDSQLCGEMCKHIGPKAGGGLGCEEGMPVYDSDIAGPPDVPNETCEEFCVRQQANGAVMNPKCLIQITACDQIEAARNRVCP